MVRMHGSLSGYAWGVERKRILLDRETPDARRLPASFNAASD
jgi:hypothetical protein